MLIAGGLCVFCERRDKKQGEGRDGKGEGSDECKETDLFDGALEVAGDGDAG